MIDHHSQHYLFAYKALPTIFYTQGKEFLFYLDRDGKKFLKFWWDHAAEKLEESQLRSPEGLSFEVHDYKNRKLVLIILPPPDVEEVYYLAMLSRSNTEPYFPWNEPGAGDRPPAESHFSRWQGSSRPGGYHSPPSPGGYWWGHLSTAS